MIEEFLTLYSEAGMIGIVGAMFMFLVYSMSKRANQQAEALEALKIENEEQSTRIANIESITLKFLDRWNRSDETRDRRHEDMLKEVNSLSDVIMEVKGSVSRINGRN
jgi:type II secretory pathway pseudopilin PulG